MSEISQIPPSIEEAAASHGTDGPLVARPEAVAEQVAEEAGRGRETVLTVAAGRYAELGELLKAAGAGRLSEDFVHDVRVASRRVGEAVGAIEEIMDPRIAEVIADALKHVRRAAGDLRDLDVLHEHLGKWRFPAGFKAVRQNVLAGYPAQRAAREAELKAQLNAASFTGSMVLLARVLEEYAAADAALVGRLEAAVTKRIKRRRKQLRAAFGRAARKQTAAALHAARIAGKKLRYTLELADAAGVAKAGKEIKYLKGMQQLLGEMHDVDVIVETLQNQWAANPRTPKQRGAWRTWTRRTAREQAERAAEFFAKSYLWMNGKL